MKKLLLVLASCLLSSCITTAKHDSKTNSPELLRNITLYTTHYEGQGKSREEVNSYKEIIYFDSRGGVTVLRPEITDRVKRVSIGEWRMEGEEPESSYKISKTENSMRVRVQMKSTLSPAPRFEKQLCLDIWYAICSEDDKNALSERCYRSKTNCYLETIGEPIGLNDGSFRLHYTANHVYEEDFGRKHRRNAYRKINSFEVFREEKGDSENLKNLWKKTRVATKERLEKIALREKAERKRRMQSTQAVESDNKATVAKKYTIPDGCKIAKVVATTIEISSGVGGCMMGLLSDRGCIKTGFEGVRTARKERWIQGIKYICK